MVACSHCGRDVTGKKFCPDCGAAVSHCPACQASVAVGSAFCTECGHDMRVAANATNTVSTNLSCPQCGKQNAPDMRFCGGCGYHLTGVAASPSDPYASSAPQYQQQQGASYQYQQGSNYNQPTYPQQQQQYPHQQGYQQQPSYPQQQYMQQGGYQPQPMMGQQPMVLRCPTCMAMAPVGSASCPGCRTSLAGVLPTPAGMQSQQQGGFLQGNNGKLAMGVLGGAAAVLGGEMLFRGVENGIENRVEDDMGYGGRRHHRRDDDRGPLGGLGELADDIGLF